LVHAIAKKKEKKKKTIQRRCSLWIQLANI
jgi:hypothetical protein